MSNISLFCKKQDVEKDLAKLKRMDQYDFRTIDSLIELLEEALDEYNNEEAKND
jgi:hypothetical protein